MRKIIFNIFSVVLFIALTALSFSPANAAGPKGKERVSQLDRYQMSQLGNSEILLIFYGKNLPAPEIVVFEDSFRTEITFRNSTNYTKLSDPIEGSPILDKIEFEQRSDDAVIVLHSLNDNLLIKDVKGLAPSDRFSLSFTTQRQSQRTESEVELLQKRLPVVPLIPDFQKDTLITLDVVEVSLSDVVRLLADKAKKNIIIDNSLPSESVTMVLDKVPLNTAVEHLKKMYDVDFALFGDTTIMAGSRNGLARLTGREMTRSFHIAYAEVTSVPALLAGVMQLSGMEQQSITVDPRLRQLYVTASPERLDEIAVALQSIDGPGKQIMLQARIFEFNDNFTEEVDAMVNAIYDNWYFSYAGGATSIGVATDAGLRGTFPSSGLPVASLIDGSWRYIDSALAMQEENNIGRVLANPSVITYDGQEATVQLRQERPYRVRQVGTSGGEYLYTTEFKDAGPSLRMKPTIGRDGIVTIQVTLETSEFTEWTDDGPATATRVVTTNVRVRDGEPFVVGGLHSEVDTKLRHKIPILGDIPLLGALFRFQTDNTRKTQVVMLVVPHILNTPDVQIEGTEVPFRR